MFSRRTAITAAFALFAAACATGRGLDPQVTAIPPHIAAAVASADRTAAMKNRDAGRKPAEVFTLAGLEVGDRVIELGSFGQYDTTIIVNAVGPAGHVYMYDLPYQEARQTAPSQAFVAAHSNAEHVFGKFDDLTYPQGVDMVVIDMYYHDLTLQDVDTAVLNRKMFDALRPGGRVLIVDHNAEAGSGRRDSRSIHRIDPAVIKDEMAQAGFRLVVDSSLFDNPSDDLSKMVFEPGERGATDRSLLVFEKP